MFLLLCRNSLSSFVLNLLVCSGLAIVALQTWPGGPLHPLAWLGGVGLTTLPFFLKARLEGAAVLRLAERMMIGSTAVMARCRVVASLPTRCPAGSHSAGCW